MAICFLFGAPDNTVAEYHAGFRRLATLILALRAIHRLSPRPTLNYVMALPLASGKIFTITFKKSHIIASMKHTTAGKQARLFKALMHPVRIQIIEILRNDEACVCHIEAMLGLRQAYVSQQLAVLRKAGFIRDRREGPNIYYQITRREVLDLLDVARTLVGEDEPWQPLPAGCACPRCTTTISLAKQGVPPWST